MTSLKTAAMLAIASACVPATSASQAAGAVTIGSDLAQAPDTTIACANSQTSCSFVQSALPNRQVGAPTDGVIVKWRTRMAFSGGKSGTLRILRALGGASYSAVAHSATTSLAQGAVGTYETRIPIEAGDLVGMSGSYASISAFRAGVSGATMDHFSPPLTDAAIGSALGAPTGRSLQMNADVEPDLDADGFGDQTQDLCPSDATSQADCSADLQVTTTATQSGIGLLTDMTFFVKVRNIGPGKAPATTMTDVLGSLMRVDALATDAGTCSGGPTVVCDLGTVEAAKTVTIRIDTTGIARGAVRAVASGSSAVADPNQANNSAAVDTAVLNPGACGNNRSGGGGNDDLRGTAAGDTLFGANGNDTISGGPGYDCLQGGAGDDKLYGESDDDRLSGGSGADKLEGGTGMDTYSGGGGNDIINSRDKIAEKVACGKGRDRVTADPKDKLTRCEKVSRKK